MTRFVSPASIVWTAVVLSAALAGAQSSDDLSRAPTWQAPDAQQVEAQALAWLAERQADEATRAKAEQLWSTAGEPTTESELLDRLAATFALADANAAALVALCSRPRDEVLLPGRPWLTDPETSPLVAHNMRLLYGRWLVHEELIDESREQLSGLQPSDVVSPASLLFYQGVVGHRLLDKESGLLAIEQLLDGSAQSPRRFVAVARLMQQDLQAVKEDTLDHISRRMDDIRRRLDLGRAGERVRKVEDGVIASLDKLIEEIEKKQQQQQGKSGQSQDNTRSNTPAPDSRIIGGKGPGEVTRRSVGSESGWGDLPPKEREEALQQIGRDFPSHYRDVIEQYFRRLAGEQRE